MGDELTSPDQATDRPLRHAEEACRFGYREQLLELTHADLRGRVR